MADYKDYGYHSANATHAHQYIAQPIIKLLNKNTNQTILDLGCGNGALVKQLSEIGFNAYGTDASETGIKIASTFSKERFAVQDLSTDELPEKFANLNFDTIISTEVIEHLYDPRKFIQFCKKILVKNGGGELILSTPYHGYIKNLLLAITGKWDQHANPLWDGGHIKLWSKNTISQLLVEQDFKVTDFVGCGRIPYVWMSMVIKATI
ncbi:methyltransferase domain-containing protein [Pedobacter sp. LMG 31464]|uniref:Methyltransferase domain-containing protein n=1 Tax=Pedobacter planticolens TaxID=2679964 RepID=A0A923DW06_9SPHI|nr:methyltransferase domain-containing protein [Pedobacter planticolens]MBB2144086.1 methyltransferase domain-containing protein [Pedobacter planticolens]